MRIQLCVGFGLVCLHVARDGESAPSRQIPNEWMEKPE